MKESNNNIYQMIPILALLAVFLLLGAVNNSWADSACQSYYEELSVTSITPFGAFNGGALIIIGDGNPEQAMATAVILGSADGFDPNNPEPISVTRAGELFFMPGLDGSVHALTAIVKAEGIPSSPNTFDVSGKVRFTGGVGRYENAHGHASINGVSTVDLQTAETTFNALLIGKICGVGD